MALDPNLDNANYSKFAIISARSNFYCRFPLKVTIYIEMANHEKGEYPNFKEDYVSHVKPFLINAAYNVHNPNIKFYIYEAIMKLFPKVLCDGEDVFTWGLDINLAQMEEKLLAKLLENRHFYDPKTTFPVIISTKSNVRFYINHPLYKWIIKTYNKKSELTLERIATNFIAKKCMKNVIKPTRNGVTDFFAIARYDTVLSKSLSEKTSFFNIIFNMYWKNVPTFKEKYLLHLEQLNELNHNLLKELRSYCPNPEDYDMAEWDDY